ncbi:MAG: hypothetical protein ACM3N3_05325 [Betaproteobacteria bacterium]
MELRPSDYFAIGFQERGCGKSDTNPPSGIAIVRYRAVLNTPFDPFGSLVGLNPSEKLIFRRIYDGVVAVRTVCSIAGQVQLLNPFEIALGTI